MSRSFSIKLTSTPNTLIEKAKKVAEENDATFSGDTTSGSFTGSGVEGSYEITGDTVTVTISKKPFYATWSIVESRVRVFFT